MARLAETTLNTYASELIARYIENYEKKYHSPPRINRNKLKWGFKDLVSDLGKARGLEVIDFYFTLDRRAPHGTSDLLYGYDKLDQMEEDLRLDEIRRLKIRAATEERVKNVEDRATVT